jgi:hypothetical protein
MITVDSIKEHATAAAVVVVFIANVLNAITHHWTCSKGLKRWVLFLLEVCSFSSSKPMVDSKNDIFVDAKDPALKVQP